MAYIEGVELFEDVRAVRLAPNDRRPTHRSLHLPLGIRVTPNQPPTPTTGSQ